MFQTSGSSKGNVRENDRATTQNEVTFNLVFITFLKYHPENEEVFFR